jgi:hypothetical protein
MKQSLIKKGLLVICILASLCKAYSTDSVKYEYDNAGNRTSYYEVTLKSAKIQPDTQPLDSIPMTAPLGNRKITVYPNPTKGALAVETTGGDANDKVKITLYSPTGAILQNIESLTGYIPVNLSDYPTGWYILRITCENQTTEFKIIKQ